MRYSDVTTMLTQTGIPFAYYSFPEKIAPPLPYMVFFYPQSNNIPADDSVYQRVDTLNIELLTKTKNFAVEENIEAVLDAWGMVWEKSEIYLNDEHAFEVLYEMEIVINGE